MSFTTSNYAQTNRVAKGKRYLAYGLIGGFTALFGYGFYVAGIF